MRTKLLTLIAALLCSTTMFAYDLWVYPLVFNLDAETQTAEVTYLNNEGGYGYNYGRNIASADIPETVEKDGVTYTVTSIGDHAFENCKKLNSVTVPGTVTSIGRYAFAFCETLPTISVPNSVKSIGDYAFYECSGADTESQPGTIIDTGLTTVNIGSGVATIGSRVFKGCSVLTAINVANNNLNFCSVNGVLLSKYKKTLITYPCGKEGFYNIPLSVTTIKANAFDGCANLTGVSIPDNVTDIEDYAFNNCNNLPIEDGLRYADTYLVETRSNKTSYSIREGTRWIGPDVFRNNTTITDVVIPNSVTTISAGAFHGCTGLSLLVIPDKVASIGRNAFYNVPQIKYFGTATGGPWGAKQWIGSIKEVYTVFDRSAEIPTLTYYYDNRRTSRSGLTELYDPNAVRFLGSGESAQKAFIDPSMKDAPLTSLKNLFFGGVAEATPTSTNDSVKLTRLTTIEGLENLNTANVTDMSSMFAGCSALTTLDLSSFSIENLMFAYNMFYGCSSLATIFWDKDLSASTKLTADYMFTYCAKLVGGKGTEFDYNKIDKTYARPDGTDNPGYFTATATEVYTEFDAATGTLTYYYDDLRHTRSGVTEVYDPVNHPWATRFESYSNDVIEVVIDPSMANANLTSLNCFFSGSSYSLINLATIKGLEHLNTTNVTDMSAMFFCCYGLKTIDITSFNTEKLVNASKMFANCAILTTIYCNEAWTQKLTNSEEMFFQCTSLIGGTGPFMPFDETKTDGTYARPNGNTAPGYFTMTATEVYTEFDEATGTLTYYYDDRRHSRSGITELYDPDALRFNGINTLIQKAVIDPSMKDAPLTTMQNLFFGGMDTGAGIYNTLFYMTAIEGLGNLNTANVTNMNHMFLGCHALQSLDLSSFNTANVTSMNLMFYYLSLQLLDLSSFDVSKVEGMNSMFYQCESLKTIFCDGDWSTSTALKYSSGMFEDCTSLVGGNGTFYDPEKKDKTYARPDEGPGAPGYFTKKEAMVYTVFDEATGTLTYRYDDQFDVSNPYVEFYDPVNIPNAIRFTDYYKKVQKAVIAPSMQQAPLTSTNSMFYGGFNSDTGKSQNLPNLTAIEGLENLNTSEVTDMQMMFMSCVKLQALDVSSFDVSKVTNMMLMFSDCKVLMTIFCSSNWATLSAVTQSDAMFHSCNMLVGGRGTPYDYSRRDITSARPDGGESSPGYFTMRGDANGDDQVNMNDAVSIVNAIMGNPSSGFSPGAANVNGDVDEQGEPKVSISDAVGVVNMLLDQE